MYSIWKITSESSLPLCAPWFSLLLPNSLWIAVFGKKRFKLTRTCTCVSNASSADWCVLSTWSVETRIRQEKNGRIVIAIYPDNQHVSNFDLLLTCNRQIFHNSLRCWLVVIQNTLKLHTCTSFSLKNLYIFWNVSVTM